MLGSQRPRKVRSTAPSRRRKRHDFFRLNSRPAVRKSKEGMNVALRERAIGALASAPPAVQKAFIKQMNFLAQPTAPSLHAKKYNEAKDLWQARVNDDWRFYFTIEDDAYIIHEVISHPK